MDLVFDIATSAEFWRQRYPLDRAPKAPTLAVPNDCAIRREDIGPMLPQWVDETFLKPTNGMLHVLALEDTWTRTTRSTTSHQWSGPIPEGSFYELQSGVFIESPAFMFLHAATILDFPQLVAFGDELCGHYSFDERQERGFRKRKIPLISKGQLERYLVRSEGCKGRKAALRALSHVVDHSASPMETFDEMTMVLPYRLGGYGLYRPIMNHPIPLNERAARIAQRETCYLDMGYPDGWLDVEHHGKLDHMSNEDRESDFARVSGLKEMGFEVIELTYEQVNDIIAYESIVLRIARNLGKRIHKTALGPTDERMELRRRLAEWNRGSGRIR